MLPLSLQSVIGASLSEPHTSVTALRTCVCMLAYLLAAIYRKIQMSTFKYFLKIDLVHEACFKRATAMPKCSVGDSEGS